MKNYTKYFLLLFPVLGFSQTKQDTIKAIDELIEVVVSNKLPSNYSKLPNQVVTVSAKQIDFQNFQSTAEMLSNSGSLFVQKSQQGGGSPAIRGFEASRVLLLVDGVRMNNLIFRAGHLQNVITVDESMLENVGIFYGPTSTLFGSDALGGTVAMTTKRAKFLGDAKNKFTGGINTRYSSANEEKSVALTFNYATTNFASLSILSFNDFGDLRMGKQKNHNGDYFGERPNYVTTVNGVDQLNVNDDKYTQVGSAYKQYNFLQKLAYKTTSGFEHGLNLQFSTSSDINRYDRLTETAGSGLRHAEWYYGPQQRVLGIYSLSKEKAVLGSDLKVNVAFQNAQESRHNRRFGNYNLQNREENVNMYSVGIDLDKKFTKGELFYGFESYFETLKSSAYANNINTGVRTDLDTRYPNGDNNMMRNDLYVSYNEKMSEKTIWNAGARIGYTTLKSTIADDTFFPLPFSSISQGNFTFSGTLGIVHQTSNNFTIKANLASGFRAPNLSELTSNGVHEGSNRYEIGNATLKNEQNIQFDLNLEYKSEHFEWFANGFYNHINNYIYIAPTGTVIDGNNVYNYVQNNAQLYGSEVGIHFHPHPYDWLHFTSSFENVIAKQDGSNLPLIPANQWKNNIKAEFEYGNWFKEGFASMFLNYTFKQNNFGAFETKTNDYFLVNFALGGKVAYRKTNFNLSVNANNVLNKTYVNHLSRLKADGINNMGRNIILSLSFAL